jgi:hypothetical protein
MFLCHYRPVIVMLDLIQHPEIHLMRCMADLPVADFRSGKTADKDPPRRAAHLIWILAFARMTLKGDYFSQ